jgi:hypothetical protein
MISNGFKIGLAAVLLALLGAASVLLHWQNDRLRFRIADARRNPVAAEPLRVENARLQSAITRAHENDGGAERAIHEELVRARREVAEAEQRAALRHAELRAQAAGDAEALATNRDPQRGLVRLENFANAGQATPSAAFQTLVWAALKGDEATLARLLLLSPPARSAAEELIASLPEDMRRPWTPEKLAALAITSVVMDVSAAAIDSEVRLDAQHATVGLRIPGIDASKSKLGFQLGVEGWQVVVPPEQIEMLRRRLASLPVSVAKK